MFHKQDQNWNDVVVFVKKQLWLSRLTQELKDSKKKKSLDLGFKNFTKFFVPWKIANSNNWLKLMLAKKV